MSLVTGWSLGGRGIRMKYAIRLVLCVVCFACLTAVNLRAGQAATWQWVHSTDRYSEYIDASALPQNPVKNEMVIAWTKVVDSQTGISYEYQFKFDLSKKTMYRLMTAWLGKDNRPIKVEKYGRSIDSWNHNDEADEWLVRSDIYSDFYWYVRDYVLHTNDFDKVRDTNNRLVYLGNGVRSDGTIDKEYADVGTIVINESALSYTQYTNNNKSGEWYIIRKNLNFSQGNTDYASFMYIKKAGGSYKRIEIPKERGDFYPGSYEEVAFRIMKKYAEMQRKIPVSTLDERKDCLKLCFYQIAKKEDATTAYDADIENLEKKLTPKIQANLKQELCDDYKARIKKLNLPLDKMPEVTNFMAKLSPDSVTDLFKTVIYNDDDKEYKAFFHAVPFINLSIEYIVAYDEKYKSLFTDGERKICQNRLVEKYGYKHGYKPKTEPAGNGAESIK